MSDFNGRARSILAPKESIRPQARPEQTQNALTPTESIRPQARPEQAQGSQTVVDKEREDLFALFTQMLTEYRNLSANPTVQPVSENPDRQFYESTLSEMDRFGGVSQTTDAQTAVPAPPPVTTQELAPAGDSPLATTTPAPEATAPRPPSQSVINLKDDKTLKDYASATTAGKRGLQDIEGIVLHHTHSSRPISVDNFISGGKERGFGAPFFIDRDGVVHQVAPLEEIIQHTSASKGTGVYRDPKGKRYSSANTIGIEVDAQWDYSADRLKEGPNEAQRIALNNLVNELLPQLNSTRGPENQLNVDNSVFAHPELQAKKEEEATGLLNWLRVTNGFNEKRNIDRQGNVQVSVRPKARPEQN